jgi:4-hydroxy-tetrahydrodipicolinate reductase
MNIAVNGAAGAMGKRIIALAVQQDDCRVVAALECGGHPAIGRDAGTVAGVEAIGVSVACELSSGPDVLVDFSVPEAAAARADECAEQGVAVLVGTTGLSSEQRSRIEQHVATRVPVIIASNTSLGVNLLFRLVEDVATTLRDGYDVEIVEAHHRRKKDSPSGTARELARRICAVRGVAPGAVLRHGREGSVGPRTPEEIGVHAVRGGDIVGEHTVMFAAVGERMELTHRATSRDVFARGALRAARFLCGKAPGLYTMQDVLA